MSEKDSMGNEDHVFRAIVTPDRIHKTLVGQRHQVGHQKESRCQAIPDSVNNRIGVSDLGKINSFSNAMESNDHRDSQQLASRGRAQSHEVCESATAELTKDFHFKQFLDDSERS
jgi:hypothetical protein